MYFAVGNVFPSIIFISLPARPARPDSFRLLPLASVSDEHAISMEAQTVSVGPTDASSDEILAIITKTGKETSFKETIE